MSSLAFELPLRAAASPFLNTQTFQGKTFHSDFMDNTDTPDFVLPIGPSARFLAHMMIRKPVASVLDLGTGCGVLGILAADNANSVTATDINPRALEITRLNAQINGVVNIETLQGSYFEPVRGRKFDLILANLPYVITPQSKYVYRDAVAPDRKDLLNLLAELPHYLQANGFAHLNLSWTYSPRQNPWGPILYTLKNLGVDAMLFLAADFTPEQYAAFWLADQVGVKDWADWYQKQGMECFALGHLILRSRPASKNWFTIFHLDVEIHKDVGDRVEQLFHAQDQVETLQGPDDLVNAVFQLQDVQIFPSDNGHVTIVEPSEFQLKMHISLSTAATLGRLNGKKTLRTVFTEMNKKPTPSQLHEVYLLMQFGMIEMKDNPTQRRTSK